MIELIAGLLLLIVTFLLLAVILIGVFFAIDLFLDLPYVATKKDKTKTIIKFAQIKKGRRSRSSLRGQTVIDLGSGDGRLLLEAAKLGAFAIGYELNPFLIALTILRAKLKGLSDHIELYRKNLWQADLKVADVIFVYGRKKTMKKFEEFVFKNAKKGTTVTVNTNPFPAKKPLRVGNEVYLYEV